jgi:condensin complex subunit 1
MRNLMKGTYEASSAKKLSADHPVFERLRDMIQLETPLNEWYLKQSPIANSLTSARFGVAEQAINAIYLLASQPDVLCGDIVKEKTRSVFARGNQMSGIQEPEVVGANESEADAPSALSAVRSLSQLLFIVGHIASTW